MHMTLNYIKHLETKIVPSFALFQTFNITGTGFMTSDIQIQLLRNGRGESGTIEPEAEIIIVQAHSHLRMTVTLKRAPTGMCSDQGVNRSFLSIFGQM